MGRKGKSWEGARVGDSSSKGQGECGKAPQQGPEETSTSLSPPPQHHFIAGGREGGEQKVSGLEKGDCESHWLWMETEQERAEGEVKNSPSSVGGWGGGVLGGAWGQAGVRGRLGGKGPWAGEGGGRAGLGETGLLGAHLDGGAPGDSENSWSGGNSWMGGPGVPVGTDGGG